jgi:hypothetical protein
MARIFDRNMFIMLLAIMLGIIIITYFVADIVNQSKITSLTNIHTIEIESIEEKNINFTSNFLESSVLLDSAREFRAFGNYHFDLASLFFTTTLSERNITSLILYKNRTIDNCTMALPMYMNSHLNFIEASIFFDNTKKYTNYENYLDLLDLYVNLTHSGSKLTILRYNASKYLKYLAENITISDGIANLENVSDIMELFNETINMYNSESYLYAELEEEIDEYNIKGFDPKREPT